MFNLIQGFVLSDTFLVVLLLIALISMTRWAIQGQKAYRPYILGWMIGLLFIVVLRELMGPTPEGETTVAEPVTLPFADVMVALVLGVLCGGAKI